MADNSAMHALMDSMKAIKNEPGVDLKTIEADAATIAELKLTNPTLPIFISSSPHSPFCNNKLLAIASLNNNITTWACYNSSWPNSTQACLTLLAFLATTFLPNTNISITSNDSSFIQILENTARILTHILASLDKSHYTFILLTVKAIITPLNLSFNIDKEFKHTEKPDNLIELNIKPQEFLFNRFIPCLLSSPCTYHLRTIIKDNLKIINSLK